MIFLLAGHHNADPGAPGLDGVNEADHTKLMRAAIAAELDLLNAPYILDKDFETLSQMLSRIKPGDGSVLLDIHFNSATQLATGTEVIVAEDANENSRFFANDLVKDVTGATALYNRGVRSEKQSHRGRLAVLHTKAGIAALLEVCFINNPHDMIRYRNGMKNSDLPKRIAKTLVKYEKKK